MTSILLIKSMLLAEALQNKKKKKIRKLRKRRNLEKTTIIMCRICNEEKGEIPIFDNLVHQNIPEEIKHFSGVTISKTDNLSKKMCQSCLDLLNGCIMFREICQKNNEMLLEVSIKTECDVDYNRNEDSDKPQKEIDYSYKVPSPDFSDDNSESLNCSICNKQFCDATSYETHLMKCSLEESSSIPKPSKKTQKEANQKKIFLCDICGKTAVSKASLLTHMCTHENVFPYKCDVCPYKGRTVDLLRVHKRSHLREKPFKCSLCPKGTTTSSNLAKHMRHVHSTARPHKCNYCDKAFTYQHDMKRHIKDIHLRQGTVECNVCHKKFNTKKILQGHKWKIHKIKGERQGRLPSYLQCQIGGQIENENENDDLNNCDPNSSHLIELRSLDFKMD